MNTMAALRVLSFARTSWFYLLLPFWLFSAWSLSQMPEVARDPLLLERVLLFDFAVFLPLLYLFSLRGRLRPFGILVRCIGLALAGLWFAGWLMPQGEGQIIPWLRWLRRLFLPIAIVIEVVAFLAIMKIAYSAEPDEAKLLASGLPRWVARALIAEARFWRWVWRNLSGRG